VFPHLGALLRRRGGLLSGGERQMVAVARTLMLEPRLLVLDEPAAGLSPKYVDLLYDGLQRIKEARIAILLVEHNAARALEFSDSAFVLDRGELVLSEAAAHLKDSELFRQSYVNIREFDSRGPEGIETGQPAHGGGS
jgi:branched-chain amino acid transport system ATP-binding protein